MAYFVINYKNDQIYDLIDQGIKFRLVYIIVIYNYKIPH